MISTLLLFLGFGLATPLQHIISAENSGIVRFDTKSWFIKNGFHSKYTGDNWITEEIFICDSTKTNLAVFSGGNFSTKKDLLYFNGSTPDNNTSINITNGKLDWSTCSYYIKTNKNQEESGKVNVFFVDSWEYLNSKNNASSYSSNERISTVVYGIVGKVSGITCGSGTIFTATRPSGYLWVSTSGRVSAGKKILGISKTQNSSVCYTDGENSTPVTVSVVEPYGVSR